jgi:hypothetical protein
MNNIINFKNENLKIIMQEGATKLALPEPRKMNQFINFEPHHLSSPKQKPHLIGMALQHCH